MDWVLEWISAHKVELTAFFSTSTFLSIVALIHSVVKNGKDVALNSKIGKKLTASLEKISLVKDELTNLTGTNDELRDTLIGNTEAIRINTNHVDALIDLISLLCSHSKDEDVRKQSTWIVNSLKYQDSIIVDELRKEVDVLKTKLESTIETENTVEEHAEEPVENDATEKTSLDAPVTTINVSRG